MNALTPSCRIFGGAGSLSSALSVQAAGARRAHPLSAPTLAERRALRLRHRMLLAPPRTSCAGRGCCLVQPPLPSCRACSACPVCHSQCYGDSSGCLRSGLWPTHTAKLITRRRACNHLHAPCQVCSSCNPLVSCKMALKARRPAPERAVST